MKTSIKDLQEISRLTNYVDLYVFFDQLLSKNEIQFKTPDVDIALKLLKKFSKNKKPHNLSHCLIVNLRKRVCLGRAISFQTENVIAESINSLRDPKPLSREKFIHKLKCRYIHNFINANLGPLFGSGVFVTFSTIEENMRLMREDYTLSGLSG